MSDQGRNTMPPFVIMPQWVLAADIPPTAKLVYAALWKRMDNDNHTCWPSRETIAADVGGCAVATVDRSLKELASIGAVTWKRRRRADGAPTSSLYTVHAWPNDDGPPARPEPVDNSPGTETQNRSSAPDPTTQNDSSVGLKTVARTRPIELDPKAATRADENTTAAAQLASYLAASIRDNGKGQPTPDDTWTDHMQTLLDEQGVTPTEVRRHIDWVFLWSDGWWTARVRCAEHLARSWPSITDQCAAARARKAEKPRAPGDDGQRPVRQPDVADIDQLTEHRKRHVYANLVDESELA